VAKHTGTVYQCGKAVSMERAQLRLNGTCHFKFKISNDMTGSQDRIIKVLNFSCILMERL